MQPPRRRADDLGQPRLDIQMDVFQFALEDEFARPRSRVRSASSPFRIASASSLEMMPWRASMRACARRAGEVLLGQAFVEIDGGRYLLHDRGGAAGETPAPHFVRHHEMPMTLPRFRPLTIAVAIGAAALLVVLYGITTLSVHAPPASLDPLKLTRLAKPAPSVVFAGADGKLHTLDEFKGRLVLLNLWAPWCAPCVKELPALAALQKALPQDRFAVVAVDVSRDLLEEAGGFLAAHDARALHAYLEFKHEFISRLRRLWTAAQHPDRRQGPRDRARRRPGGLVRARFGALSETAGRALIVRTYVLTFVCTNTKVPLYGKDRRSRFRLGRRQSGEMH